MKALSFLLWHGSIGISTVEVSTGTTVEWLTLIPILVPSAANIFGLNLQSLHGILKSILNLLIHDNHHAMKVLFDIKEADLELMHWYLQFINLQYALNEISQFNTWLMKSYPISSPAPVSFVKKWICSLTPGTMLQCLVFAWHCLIHIWNIRVKIKQN